MLEWQLLILVGKNFGSSEDTSTIEFTEHGLNLNKKWPIMWQPWLINHAVLKLYHDNMKRWEAESGRGDLFFPYSFVFFFLLLFITFFFVVVRMMRASVIYSYLISNVLSVIHFKLSQIFERRNRSLLSNLTENECDLFLHTALHFCIRIIFKLSRLQQTVSANMDFVRLHTVIPCINVCTELPTDNRFRLH